MAAAALAAAALTAVALSLLAGPAHAAGGGAPVPGGLSAFRVDVSQYPMVGLILTVPGGGPAPKRAALPAGDFSLSAGGQVLTPQVKQLSPDDVELAVAPDGGLPAAGLDAERGAAEAFLAGLPVGERSVAIVPDHPGVLPNPLSQDPAPAMLAVAGTTLAARGSVSARLTTALSAFTAGPQVRRTIVLAVTAAQPLSRGQSALFARRLAASGTALYVLDAAPGGAPGYDALAADSGGFAVPVTGAAGWAPALTRISASLAEQYYLRFTDPRPRPGQVLVAVSTPSGVLRGAVDLPAHNPVAPPLPSAPRPTAVLARPGPAWDTVLVLLATALIVIGISYGMAMTAASRRDPRRRRGRGQGVPRPAGAAVDLFFVFLVPCLNEEAVIANSLHRLLSLPGGNFVVLVIDDGSDDRTVEVVTSLTDPRVLLLSRRAPNARQGKGAALNAAIRYLTSSPLLHGRDPDRVIAVVVDADGRIDPDALREVTPVFDDPSVGAVQIGVRINNRFRSTLARMQDMEFVIYTEVFQRGRRHIGSVGLGGNGQFMRLSALQTLGAEPWGRSLAEDLDMGIRLIAAGWRNEYCSAVAVHQQGVEELARLIRQRSRWFQGHLQSWQKIPLVLRRVRGPARADLLYHMTSPAVLLIASLLSASFVVSVANAAFEAASGENPANWWLATTYALTFGPGLIFSAVYWSKERAEGLNAARAIMLGHLYVCYGMMWYAAGWWGISRTLRGRTSWAKTDRVVEAPLDAPAVQPAGGPVPVRAVAAPAARPVGAVAPVPAYGPATATEGPVPVPAAGPGRDAAGRGLSGPPAAPGGSRAPGRGRHGRRPAGRLPGPRARGSRRGRGDRRGRRRRQRGTARRRSPLGLAHRLQRLRQHDGGRLGRGARRLGRAGARGQRVDVARGARHQRPVVRRPRPDAQHAHRAAAAHGPGRAPPAVGGRVGPVALHGRRPVLRAHPGADGVGAVQAGPVVPRRRAVPGLGPGAAVPAWNRLHGGRGPGRQPDHRFGGRAGACPLHRPQRSVPGRRGRPLRGGRGGHLRPHHDRSASNGREVANGRPRPPGQAQDHGDLRHQA